MMIFICSSNEECSEGPSYLGNDELHPQDLNVLDRAVVYGNTQDLPSNKPGTHFLQILKKLLWRMADYLES